MRRKLCALFLFSFFLTGCDFSLSPSVQEPHPKSYKGYGTVQGYGEAASEIKVGFQDFYHFGSGDITTTPGDLGFSDGDQVYFEAKILWYNTKSNGRHTYWCNLVSIRMR